MIVIAELGSEHLRTMIYILQAYVFLSPVDFLVRSGGMINAALQVRLPFSWELTFLD